MNPQSHSSLIQTQRGVVEYVSAGDGPAVLALHGAMGGYDQSLLLARCAISSPGYRFIAVSRPGYLGTSLSLGELPEAQADCCAALLDALGIEQAAVIAVSGGGQCALQFALRHPDRCWGLVMVSACSAPLTEPLPLRFHLMKVMARIPWLVDGMRKRAARQPEQAVSRSIPDPELRARTLNDPEAGPLLMELQLSTMDRLAQRLPGTENDIKQSRRPFHYPLERITTPALVIHGTADRIAPFAHSKSLAATLPRAELLALEGGEHVTLFTHLHEIRARVRQFLGEHQPVGQTTGGSPRSSES